MNREKGTASQVGGVGGEGGAQVGGDQAGLPVVAMKDLGAEQDASDAEGRPGKDGEANVVVREIHPRIAVKPFATKERRAIDQVDRVLGRGLKDGDWERSQSKVNGKIFPHPVRMFQV